MALPSEKQPPTQKMYGHNQRLKKSLKHACLTFSFLLGASAFAAQVKIDVKSPPKNDEWHLDKSRYAEAGLTVSSLDLLSRCSRDDVKRLYLRGVKDFPLGQLSGLTQLEELDISENGLVEMPVSVLNMATLKHLWFVGNPIEKLPADIARLKALVYLNLDRTTLVQLPDELGSLSELRFLRLNDTHVESFPESLGLLSNMRRLYARNTKLKEVPRVLASWRSLEDIAFDGTEIDAVPDWLVALPKLKRVSFAGCKKLARLPDNLQGWSNLQVLDLSDTLLSNDGNERQRVRSALGDEVTILF